MYKIMDSPAQSPYSFTLALTVSIFKSFGHHAPWSHIQQLVQLSE